jgi:hypothetical protein
MELAVPYPAATRWESGIFNVRVDQKIAEGLKCNAGGAEVEVANVVGLSAFCGPRQHAALLNRIIGSTTIRSELTGTS